MLPTRPVEESVCVCRPLPLMHTSWLCLQPPPRNLLLWSQAPGRGAGWLPQGPNPFREAMIQVACKNEGHPRGGRGGVVVGPGTELLGKMPHGGSCSAPLPVPWGNFMQDSEWFLHLHPGGLPQAWAGPRRGRLTREVPGFTASLVLWWHWPRMDSKARGRPPGVRPTGSVAHGESGSVGSEHLRSELQLDSLWWHCHLRGH